MASATKRGPGKWLGRYRDKTGRERTKTFATKGEARAWAEGQEARMRSGVWADPDRAKITIAEFVDQWRGTLTVKPTTKAGYESLLSSCVLPKWGAVRLDRITTSDVRGWVANMTGAKGRPLSASRARQAYGLLSSVLDLAVEDGRLARNPAKPTNGRLRSFLPKLPKGQNHNYLTHGQLQRLAEEADDYRGFILFLGYSGLRWGEATALRLRDVDLLRSRVTVARTANEISGVLSYGSPKNHATRTIVFPAFLRSDLEAAMDGKGPDDLLFTSPQGEALRNGNFRKRVLDRASKQAGLRVVKPHDLRHTAASLAVASGANVKVVQRMLGHASASLTLDTYAGLFEADLESVAERLDQAASEAGADYLRTGAAIHSLPSAGQTG